MLLGDDVSGVVASASRGVMTVDPAPGVKVPLLEEELDLFTHESVSMHRHVEQEPSRRGTREGTELFTDCMLAKQNEFDE
jgi:hypothetical protein